MTHLQRSGILEVNYIYIEVKDMLEWWGTLDLFSQVLYCIAVPSSLILLIQIVMTTVGFGQSGPGINPDDLSGFDGLGDSVDFDLDVPLDAGVDSGGAGDGGKPRRPGRAAPVYAGRNRGVSRGFQLDGNSRISIRHPGKRQIGRASCRERVSSPV